MTNASLQSAQTLASPTHKRRSVVRSLGRGIVRFVHGELLAQGEVLQGELTVTAAEEGQDTEQVG